MSSITSSTTSTTAYIVSADTTGTLNLLTGATPTSALYIDANGSVGIGTTTLTNKLNVAGAIQSSSLLTAVAANTIAISQETLYNYSRVAAFGPNPTTGGTLYLYSISSFTS